MWFSDSVQPVTAAVGLHKHVQVSSVLSVTPVLCSSGDHVRFRFEMELARMGFDLQNAWRVSDINNNYK